MLPNGWQITPVGTHVRLPGDFPSRIIVTPDNGRILVLTSGFHHQGVAVIDAHSTMVNSSVNLGKTYGDMALDSRSGELFVAGGGTVLPKAFTEQLLLRQEHAATTVFDAAVLHAQLERDAISLHSPIRIPEVAGKGRYITGITVARDSSLFVVDINNDMLYKLKAGTYVPTASARSGYGAFRVTLSPDGKMAAVTNWGDESVSLFDTQDLTPITRVKTGKHPNDLAYGADGTLFVANSGSNTVSVIRDNRVVETIKTSIDPLDPVGSTPDAIAVDSGAKKVYVANADNNDVAVVDISRPGRSEVEGFIPTGWYPSALAVSRDGKTLFVGIAKGLGSTRNIPAIGLAPRNEPDKRNPYDFVGDTLSGYVSAVKVPNESELATLTRQVIHNIPSPVPAAEESTHTEQVRRLAFPHIHHILYIIRENRTYDQVLGDLGKGNGNPSLTLFGQSVTPNAHRMANEWVLFDNLFVNGEVSENGHQWSDAAYATDFTSQAWLQSSSGRPEPKASESELGADERLRSSPAGYIWDNCARHGISFRTYGEFAYFHSGPDEAPRFVAKGLEGHASVTWLKLASSGWHDITKGRDPDLAQVFIREMHEAEQSGNWPQFTVMSLGEDHTQALRPGRYTPAAMVASNDQALGQIVDAISHSRFWPDTAIFVIEDDAQDGPDHVDCRRTVGLVVSPYIKRGIVDSTLYTTASMIHTMEAILGLPTMTQFDRAAAVMYNAFTTSPNFMPYDNLPAQTDLRAKNPAKGPGAVASLKLDLSDYDRADPQEMNRILWNAMKPGPMPPPVRSASLNIATVRIAAQ